MTANDTYTNQREDEVVALRREVIRLRGENSDLKKQLETLSCYTGPHHKPKKPPVHRGQMRIGE